MNSVTTPQRLAATLARYSEPLLRKVAARLARPRNQWPADELIVKAQEAIDNPPVLDRRLAELPPAGQRLLSLIGRSRQMDWPLGAAVEMLMALGHKDGLAAVMELLDAGVLFPDLSTMSGKLGTFEQWLATAGGAGLNLFTLPQIASRLAHVDLELDEMPAEMPGLGAATLEADGLEWLLRLGAVWQRVSEAPLRRTQQGGLFKRDVDRIEQDTLLNTAPADKLADAPDLGFMLLEWAEQAGVLVAGDGELLAGRLPEDWGENVADAVAGLLPHLFRLRSWQPLDGWKGGEPVPGNPFPSACLLALMLLARQPAGAWLRPSTLQDWLLEHHPYWQSESLRPSQKRPWPEAFLLGVCYPLKLVQVTKDQGGAGGERAEGLPPRGGLGAGGDGPKAPPQGSEGAWLVRLSPVGRWLLAGGEEPPPVPAFPKTLTVQPNLEIIAFRQGLTPGLIGRLTRMAAWKTLGAACTLQLGPETVYRALEAGETFDTLCQALDKHGTRPTPQAVVDSLRTWSAKRDRITIYPAAALLEFATAKELDEALARGLTGTRVSDTVVVVPSEEQIDFKHFRLTGTRDYALPPQRCVTAEGDGVTLTVDLSLSDLLLETELSRFADAAGPPAGGRKQYRLTPASMARARSGGWGLAALETWFLQRTGGEAPPAARLLLTAPQAAPPRLAHHLVLHAESEVSADGLMQWPATRELIAERLGPTALAVREEDREALITRLAELGVTMGEG